MSPPLEKKKKFQNAIDTRTYFDPRQSTTRLCSHTLILRDFFFAQMLHEDHQPVSGLFSPPHAQFCACGVQQQRVGGGGEVATSVTFRTKGKEKKTPDFLLKLRNSPSDLLLRRRRRRRGTDRREMRVSRWKYVSYVMCSLMEMSVEAVRSRLVDVRDRVCVRSWFRAWHTHTHTRAHTHTHTLRDSLSHTLTRFSDTSRGDDDTRSFTFPTPRPRVPCTPSTSVSMSKDKSFKTLRCEYPVVRPPPRAAGRSSGLPPRSPSLSLSGPAPLLEPASHSDQLAGPRRHSAPPANHNATRKSPAADARDDDRARRPMRAQRSVRNEAGSSTGWPMGLQPPMGGGSSSDLWGVRKCWEVLKSCKLNWDYSWGELKVLTWCDCG